jgi:hypothetical protein
MQEPIAHEFFSEVGMVNAKRFSELVEGRITLLMQGDGGHVFLDAFFMNVSVSAAVSETSVFVL